MRRGNWYREPLSARQFGPARPRPVDGGIKADVKGRNSFKSWWARRWIEMLEDFGLGARLTRGRSYARLGQVKAIAIARGEISAVVQGTRPLPYDVTIRLATIPTAKWRAAVSRLPGQLLAAARLLSGDVCADLEASFRSGGATLLPEHARDLVCECTCADWENPCKHVAAVHYVFGAELERDPFLIFALRGISREALLAALTHEADQEHPAARRRKGRLRAKEPLPSDPAAFFRGGPLPPIDIFNLRVPDVAAAHLRPLGNLPFWRGREPLVVALVPIYRAASILACALVMGPRFEELLAERAAQDRESAPLEPLLRRGRRGTRKRSET